jgi:hypothetical protein
MIFIKQLLDFYCAETFDLYLAFIQGLKELSYN